MVRPLKKYLASDKKYKVYIEVIFHYCSNNLPHCCHFVIGVEDGQTFRIPISTGEIFVSFKVLRTKVFFYPNEPVLLPFFIFQLSKTKGSITWSNQVITSHTFELRTIEKQRNSSVVMFRRTVETYTNKLRKNSEQYLFLFRTRRTSRWQVTIHVPSTKNPVNNLAPFRVLVAQSVEHLPGVRKVMGSNPIGDSDFFFRVYLCMFQLFL